MQQRNAFTKQSPNALIITTSSSKNSVNKPVV